MPGDENKGVMERHAQTLISLVIAGLIGWVGLSLQELQNNAAAVAVEIQNIKSEVSVIRTQSANQYSIAQAARDWDRNRRELDDLRTRIRDLERKK